MIENPSMKIAVSQLSTHLSRNLAPVYVISGDEPLLVQEALDAIRAKARREGYDERQVLDADKSFDWSLLYQACASMSLFATRRIVELRLPSGAPGTEGGDLLKKLAASPSSDTLLLVVCGAMDTRQRSAAWYLALEAAGASFHAWPLGPQELPQWLEQRLRSAGLDPQPEALRLLAERTEGNLLAAAQDVDKLRLLFPGGRIDEDAVRSAVADSSRFDAFDFTDRLLGGDALGVSRSLLRLREEGVEVLEILGALTWNLRQWAQAQAEYAKSGDAQRACDAARVPRARQASLLRALPRTRLPQIYGWLRRCAQVDQLAKSTGGKEQAWEELLTLALAAAGAARKISTT